MQHLQLEENIREHHFIKRIYTLLKNWFFIRPVHYFNSKITLKKPIISTDIIFRTNNHLLDINFYNLKLYYTLSF